MNTTILIGIRNGISVKVNKWLFLISGLVWFTLGISKTFKLNYWNWNEPIKELVIGILLIGLGTFHCVYGLTAFSPNSRLALRIKVTDEFIEIKDKWLKPSIQLLWTNINSIEFGKGKIVFKQKESDKIFSYKSNANVSIKIEKLIMKMADKKKIEVLAGKCV